MKLAKITLLLLLCSTFCIAQKTINKSHIIGDIKNNRSDTIYILSANKQDTIILRNAKFDYTFKSNQVEKVTIVDSPLNTTEHRSTIKNKFIELIVVPGIPIKVTGSFDNYKIGGSRLYESLYAVQNEMKPITEELSTLRFEYGKAFPIVANKDSLAKVFSVRYASIMKKKKDFIMNYIKTHPDNEASATLIPELEEDINSGIELLSKRVKTSKIAEYYKPYKERVDKQKAIEETSKKVVPGTIAPDFNLKDIKGYDFKLSSLQGKYVLLDFWGSWCYWCIKGMPELKKYYEKYKGKFEIVGVDCGDTEQKWKAAVEKNQLPWLHVKNESTNDITAKYGVQGYPTLILIAPDGKIFKKFLGEEPDFFTTLDSLLK